MFDFYYFFLNYCFPCFNEFFSSFCDVGIAHFPSCISHGEISLFPNLTTKPPQQSHFHPQSAYRTALLLDRKLWGQLVKRKTAEEVAAVVRLLSVQEIPKQTIG